MQIPGRISRRQFLHRTLCGAGLYGFGHTLPLPLWAASERRGMTVPAASRFELDIRATAVEINGRKAVATGINGTVPGPLLRWKEGTRVVLDVRNSLGEDSSIHWHGLLLPYHMDGVPGISFAGIAPGETFRYEFDVVQNGTYWYHSHSGLQEQTGVYGPIVIEPAGADPVRYEREFVVMLSDWTFENPYTVLANLKKMDGYYDYQKRTVSDFFDDVRERGWKTTMSERSMWGRMRMSATDIADVTGASYTFLMNGLDPAANWTGLFAPGDRVRLRVINGSAMSFFNVRIPGLPMTVVQADGINIEPVRTDEFQIGVAETYDVIVEPQADTAYTIFAESMDRSGFARGTLAPRPGMAAAVPQLRPRPLLGMTDMGMQHGHEGHGGTPAARHDHARGPGVAHVTAVPRSRLHEPGIGLQGVGHRTLTYADLRRLQPATDQQPPERTLELHLTGNMDRYMWSFDGLKYSEVDGPIEFRYGERLELILVNDTMMAHPIHLHGMFVELVNGNGASNPLKHTVVVKPGERVVLHVDADAPGDWAFHCHMLYHMKAGMMRQVSVIGAGEAIS